MKMIFLLVLLCLVFRTYEESDKSDRGKCGKGKNGSTNNKVLPVKAVCGIYRETNDTCAVILPALLAGLSPSQSQVSFGHLMCPALPHV